MIEKTNNYSTTDSKNIEKLIDDEPLLINHMVLPKGEGIPEHYSNSNVYMIIVRGTLTLKLDDQPSANYIGGQIISIPYNTKMNIMNNHDGTLEFFVAKAPNPSKYEVYHHA